MMKTFIERIHLFFAICGLKWLCLSVCLSVWYLFSPLWTCSMFFVPMSSSSIFTFLFILFGYLFFSRFYFNSNASASASSLTWKFLLLPLIVFSKLKCVCSVSRRVLEHTSLFCMCVHLSCLGGGERKLISPFCSHTLDLDGSGDWMPFPVITAVAVGDEVRLSFFSSSERAWTDRRGRMSQWAIEHWTGTTTTAKMYTTSWRALLFSSTVRHFCFVVVVVMLFCLSWHCCCHVFLLQFQFRSPFVDGHGFQLWLPSL